MKSDFTCGFLGLGLIGGSIARALRQFYPQCNIIAWDINRTATELAVTEGVVNIAVSEIDEHFSSCDYIFLCAPVSENSKLIARIKHHLSKSCILTDVGSVKTKIHEDILSAGLSKQFIGGHPMSGSERTGYINSKAVLLENAYYILTPGEGCPQEHVGTFRELISSLGAIPLLLTCRQHDYVTASVSHLPHIAAATLVNLIKENDSPEGLMKTIAAGGFKDLTRIASSSPLMWQQICLENKEDISLLLEKYIASLVAMKQKIDSQNSEALYAFFESARYYRDSFIDASLGPIKKSYKLKIEIADRTGALADIVTLLASAKISIKNIGIAHNREQTDGILQVELYEEESVLKAAALLQENGYSVFF